MEKSKWVFYPEHILKIIWDLFGFIFIIYEAIFIPYRISFDVIAVGEIAVFEMAQDFFFIIDIFITANTGYYDKGNLILVRKEIISNYTKFWLWLDIISSFPYSMIVNANDYFDINNKNENNGTINAPQVLRMLKFMRFMRFLRLLRVLKIRRILIRVKLLNKNF
jgi:hyperpolarization activated cyclic nucleotide-gated potassium channel 2